MHGYLRHLANFAHVVDAGSITAAAHRLGGSPSGLSESIKVLEAQVGETLLERRRSGTVPTGRGLEIYAEAREIVAALDRALGPSARDDSATLRISLPAELAEGWFAVALACLTRDQPDLHLVLMVEDSLVDHTKYARDLHVRVGRTEARAGMTELARGETRAVLTGATALLGQTDPNDADAIARHCFLARPRATRDAKLTLAGDRSLTFARTLQISSVTARIAAARAGVGVTSCLLHSVAADIAAGGMLRLLPAGFDFPVAITIASPHRRPPPAARLVGVALGQALPQGE